MKIRKLEFDDNKFGIRKYQKNTESEWKTKIVAIKFTKAAVMKIKVDGTKETLDLNVRYFPELKEWINKLELKGSVSEEIKKLKSEITSYKNPYNSYVYVICKERIPVYVGMSYDMETKKDYWGSSETFKAIKGDKKYIIAENLDGIEASKIENYLIAKLGTEYKLENNTCGSLKVLEVGLNNKIIKKGPYEIYTKN